MHINFTPDQLRDPAVADSAVELNACLQCGYCLENCPTYRLLGEELDSPRGRIYLIKQLLEQEQTPEKETVEHLDRCLSCLACMSSCPSSVNYMHLIDHARKYIEHNYRRPLPDRALRWVLAWVLPNPNRFRMSMRLARIARPFAFALPNRIRNIVQLVPGKPSSPGMGDEQRIFPALGERKQRVALLTGCAQQALDNDINDATIRILCRHGCEVVVAKGAGCCGALTHHMGKTEHSRTAATRNIRAWMREIDGAGLDAVVINTSGCGTVIKDYGHMFRDHELAEQAAAISALARDISEVLSELELNFQVKPELRVAYHATCSLQFGQRIRFAPKKLLRAAGFTVLELGDAHLCCGSAGTYNLLQPEISYQLRANKVQALERGAPDAIAAGNIGCMIQIGAGTALPVLHTVQLLDWVTGGPIPPALDAVSNAA